MWAATDNNTLNGKAFAVPVLSILQRLDPGSPPRRSPRVRGDDRVGARNDDSVVNGFRSLGPKRSLARNDGCFLNVEAFAAAAAAFLVRVGEFEAGGKQAVFPVDFGAQQEQ